MAGETDLRTILKSLTVVTRPGRFTFVAVSDAVSLGDGIEAVIREDEATTAVVTTEFARANGWPVEFEATWLTLDVHSALEAVGLTAAVAAVLAEAGIPCNVIAGYYHDHLLVPADRAAAAVIAIESLSG